MGLRVVGLNFRHLIDAGNEDLGYIRAVYADHGLTPGAVPCGFSLLRPDPAEMDLHRKQMTRLLQVAGKLGFQVIQPSIGSMDPKGIWSYHPDNLKPRTMDVLVRNARELAKAAADSGCVVCPETTQWTACNNVTRMKEFVDRVDSRFVRVTFDFVNHMTPERVYDSGRYMTCVIQALGDRIGMFHVKDVMVGDRVLVVHIDEAPVGTGLLDHKAVIKASVALEPWKLFSMEHVRGGMDVLRSTYSHIQGAADAIGHKWTEPAMNHQRFLSEARARKAG